jgi:ATP-binding cassette subfamily F protein uup
MKLSYNEQREFDRLPGRIETLEGELRRLSETVAHPDFYKEGSAGIAQSLARLDEVQRELHAAYARWDELDSRS